MKRSSCKKLFNYYFLYRLVSISYYLLPVVFLFFFLVDAFYLYNYFLVDGSEVFEKACVPMQQSVLIFIFESVVVMFPLVLGEWIKRNTYEPLVWATIGVLLYRTNISVFGIECFFRSEYLLSFIFREDFDCSVWLVQGKCQICLCINSRWDTNVHFYGF